jgi:hypothetical protein
MINPKKCSIFLGFELSDPDLVQTWDIFNIEKIFIGFWDFYRGNQHGCWLVTQGSQGVLGLLPSLVGFLTHYPRIVFIKRKPFFGKKKKEKKRKEAQCSPLPSYKDKTQALSATCENPIRNKHVA